MSTNDCMQLSLIKLTVKQISPHCETFNGDQSQVHNATSSAVGNKTDSFMFEKRPGSVCVPAKKRRRSVQQTRLIKQCVNGLSGMDQMRTSRWFSAPSACMCSAVLWPLRKPPQLEQHSVAPCPGPVLIASTDTISM